MTQIYLHTDKAGESYPIFMQPPKKANKPLPWHHYLLSMLQQHIEHK